MTPGWDHVSHAIGSYSPPDVAWDADLTPSAVLVPLLEDGGALSILMIERATSVGRHAGEIAFPGGVVEAGDRDLLATALRETREELALAIAPRDVLGRLDDCVTGGYFIMRPFVARLESTVGLTPSPEEVAAVHIWPLATFAAEGVCRVERRVFRGARHDVPFFEIPDSPGVTVWGASARVILNLLDVIGPID